MYIICIIIIEFNECDNPADNNCDTETTMCVDTACGYDCTCLSGCEMIPGNNNMCQGNSTKMAILLLEW